jgi:hypothetical protein
MHIPIPPKNLATIKFNSVKKSFNIQELLHCKSNIMEPSMPMHPSSSRAFQRQQEHNLKHPSSVDLMTTRQNKTNYLPSYR